MKDRLTVRRDASKEIRSCIVLTADDKLRGRLELILEEKGVIVYAPKDGYNALGYLYENHIDFLMIDVECWENKNRECPGFEFAYKMRKQFGYPTLPIVFMANDESGKLYAYERFNCVDYILKPIDVEPFLLAVDKALIFSGKTSFKNPVFVKSNSVYFHIFYEDITYISVKNRDVYFHMNDGNIIEIANSHLNSYVDDSRKEGFIRIRRDTIVNSRYIKNVDFNSKILTISDDSRLEIGNTFKCELEDYVRRHELAAKRENNIKAIPIENELSYTV